MKNLKSFLTSADLCLFLFGSIIDIPWFHRVVTNKPELMTELNCLKETTQVTKIAGTINITIKQT